MKKFTLFTIALLCITLFAEAQIKKGAVYFGGSIGYGSSDEETTINNVTTITEQNGVTVSPSVGIAIKPNLIAGVSFNYGRSKFTQTQNDYESASNTVGGGIFLRKYFNITQKFYAFGEALAYYNNTSGETMNNAGTFTTDTDGWSTGVGLSPGIAYNITKAFYLEMGFNDLFRVNYSKEVNEQQSQFNPPQRRERKSFGVSSSLSSGNSLTVGVRFIIPKK